MQGMTLGGWEKRRAIHTARVLLQKTRSILKRTLQNLASVLGGEAVVRAANLAAAIAIARLYGPAILGLYGACLAVVTIVFMFAESGLQLSAITEIGAVCSRAPWLVGELYLSKAILSVFAVVFLFAVGVFGNFSHIYWVISGLIMLRTLIIGKSIRTRPLDCNDGAAHRVAPVKGPDPKLRNESCRQVSPFQARDAYGPYDGNEHTRRAIASVGVHSAQQCGPAGLVYSFPPTVPKQRLTKRNMAEVITERW
jgi:hypothetical protein